MKSNVAQLKINKYFLKIPCIINVNCFSLSIYTFIDMIHNIYALVFTITIQIANCSLFFHFYTSSIISVKSISCDCCIKIVALWETALPAYLVSRDGLCWRLASTLRKILAVQFDLLKIQRLLCCVGMTHKNEINFKGSSHIA